MKSQILVIRDCLIRDCDLCSSPPPPHHHHDLPPTPTPTPTPVPPSIRGGNVTTEVTAVLDTLVTLECEARGVPVPAVTWYRQGQAVLSSRQAQYVERGRYLKIPRAQGSDAGRYACRVTSVAGTAEKSYELDVYCEEHFNNSTHGFVLINTTALLNTSGLVNKRTPLPFNLTNENQWSNTFIDQM